MISIKKPRKPASFEKSFAAHPKSIYWHADNIYKPEDLCMFSGYVAKFSCNCGHTFNITLHHIGSHNQWCKYCCALSMTFCDDTNCLACHEKSFASHPKAIFWSDTNTLQPNKIAKQSSKYFWFDCECGHKFKTNPNSVYTGRWCPYCCKQNKKICGAEDCKQCIQYSFLSSNRIQYWDYKKNTKLPRNCTLYAVDKFWFICEYKHEFQMSLNHITGKKRWCQICVNKTKKKVYDWLSKIYNGVQLNATFDWCRNTNNYLLRYDFVLQEKKIIIEVDGRQHFTYVDYFKNDYRAIQITDKFKMLRALQNGYSIIRIHQPDVLNNTIDWEDIIEDLIEYRDHWSIMYVAKNPDQYQQYYIEDILFIHNE